MALDAHGDGSYRLTPSQLRCEITKNFSQPMKLNVVLPTLALSYNNLAFTAKEIGATQ